MSETQPERPTSVPDDRDEYILLPNRGVRAKTSSAVRILGSMPELADDGREAYDLENFAGGQPLTIIEKAEPMGAMLVKASPEVVELVNESDADIRLVKKVTYSLPKTGYSSGFRKSVNSITRPSGHYHNTTIKCVDSTTSAPIRGCEVIAYTDLHHNAGGFGFTDGNGEVTLQLARLRVELLLVIAEDPIYWGRSLENVSLNDTGVFTVRLTTVNRTDADAISDYYPYRRFEKAMGVTVGVIDTGVFAHSELSVIGGENTVVGESKYDFDDSDNHGTHVAGIIGSMRGMAPGCNIWAGRVFDQNNEASNFSVLKATIKAAANNCDIINLSLGGGDADDIVEEAFLDCKENGILAVIAAGNDDRGYVNYPAAYNDVIAVTAMGNSRNIPPGSFSERDIVRPPYSTVNSDEYIAGFSNFGHEIDVTGLGTGIISTLRTGGYGQMSGTSMAAPFIAGCAASMLSQNPVIYSMPRTKTRTSAMIKMLTSNCIRRGFGQNYEGYGLPDPNVV